MIVMSYCYLRTPRSATSGSVMIHEDDDPDYCSYVRDDRGRSQSRCFRPDAWTVYNWVRTAVSRPLTNKMALTSMTWGAR